jgi:hypothetical protein
MLEDGNKTVVTAFAPPPAASSSGTQVTYYDTSPLTTRTWGGREVKKGDGVFDSLQTATRLIGNPEELVNPGNLPSLKKHLGRIALLPPLDFSGAIDAQDLQRYNQQIDTILKFIERAPKDLATPRDLTSLKQSLLSSKRSIAIAALRALHPVVQAGEEHAAVAAAAQTEEGAAASATTTPSERGAAAAPVAALSSTEKEALCNILQKSINGFAYVEGSDPDQLQALERELEELSASSSQLKKSLSEAVRYVKDQLLVAESYKSPRRAIVSVRDAVALLRRDQGERLSFGFGDGIFVSEVRRGFIAWLERFLGWVGASPESRDAGSALLSDLRISLKNIIESATQPEAKAAEAHLFFTDFIVTLEANEWFQGTIKHNPDLKEIFRQINAEALGQMHASLAESVLVKGYDRESQPGHREQYQELTELEQTIRVLKQHSEKYLPDLTAAFDIYLTDIAGRKAAIFGQHLVDIAQEVQAISISEVDAREEHPAYVRALETAARECQALEEADAEQARSCGAAQTRSLIERRRTYLDQIRRHLQNLGHYLDTVRDADRRANPIADFPAFMTMLRSIHEYVQEATHGQRTASAEDLKYAGNAYALIKLVLKKHPRFAAAIGEANLEQVMQLRDDFDHRATEIHDRLRPSVRKAGDELEDSSDEDGDEDDSAGLSPRMPPLTDGAASSSAAPAPAAVLTTVDEPPALAPVVTVQVVKQPDASAPAPAAVVITQQPVPAVTTGTPASS